MIHSGVTSRLRQSSALSSMISERWWPTPTMRMPLGDDMSGWLRLNLVAEQEVQQGMVVGADGAELGRGAVAGMDHPLNRNPVPKVQQAVTQAVMVLARQVR